MPALHADGPVYRPSGLEWGAMAGGVVLGTLVGQSLGWRVTFGIVAAVISPGTDVVSQALMAGPMLGLYGISILIAWIVAPRKATIHS